MTTATSSTKAGGAQVSGASARMRTAVAGRPFAEQVQMLMPNGNAAAAGILGAPPPPPPSIGGTFETDIEAATMAGLLPTMSKKDADTLTKWGLKAGSTHEADAAKRFTGASQSKDINNAFTVGDSELNSLLKNYKSDWNTACVAALIRIRGAMNSGASKTSFLFACLRNSTSRPAVQVAWYEEINFSELIGSEAAIALDPSSPILKEKPDLWSVFLKTGNGKVLAGIPPKHWPADQQAKLIEMLATDRAVMTTYVSTHAATLATWLKPADMAASNGLRLVAADLVRMKSAVIDGAVIDALLKADPHFVTELQGYVGVDPKDGQTEFRKWLAAKAVKPFSSEMATVFNAFTDHFGNVEKEAAGKVASAKTPEEVAKAKSAQETARANLEVSVEQRHALTIAGQDEKVHPDSQDPKKADAFTGGALRRVASTLNSLPTEDVQGAPLDRLVREKAPADSPCVKGGHVFQTAIMEWANDERLENARLSAYASTASPKDDKGKAKFDRDELQFDHALRHEVGHAVDADKKVMNSQGSQDARGGWKHVAGGIKDVAKAAGETAAFDKLPSEKVTAIDQSIKTAWPNIAKEDATLAQTKTGKWLTRMVDAGLPFNILDPVAFGDRVYVFESGWLSYSKAAHNRRVSGYQFKSPGEWFAEAYATYYDTPENPGLNLEKVDPGTKSWLDQKGYKKPSAK